MWKKGVAVTAALIFLVTFIGCESMSDKDTRTVAGAGVGAATGTAAGLIFGQGAAIAVAGGLIGALAGGLVGRYAFGSDKDHAQTASDYQYQETMGSMVEIEHVSVSPSKARPGEQVDMKVKYAVLTPNPDSQIEITESREIRLNGELVGRPTVNVQRTGGTYTSDVPITLPADAKKGSYTVKTTIRVGDKIATGDTSFMVI